MKVHSFPGATTEDMGDFIKPLLRQKPSKIFLHVGTNTISQPGQTARSCAEGIVDLARYVTTESPDTEVTISGMTTRNDVDGLSVKISEANKILQQFCRQNAWAFLPNSNIENGDLNGSGLHLSKTGTSKLASNFINCIRNK